MVAREYARCAAESQRPASWMTYGSPPAACRSVAPPILKLRPENVEASSPLPAATRRTAADICVGVNSVRWQLRKRGVYRSCSEVTRSCLTSSERAQYASAPVWSPLAMRQGVLPLVPGRFLSGVIISTACGSGSLANVRSDRLRAISSLGRQRVTRPAANRAHSLRCPMVIVPSVVVCAKARLRCVARRPLHSRRS